MRITNRNLSDKLDKIYSRVNKNCTQIAVLSEHVKNQNSRVGKLEDNTNGLNGILQEHEGEIRDLANFRENIQTAQLRANKWNLVLFGGILTAIFTAAQFVVTKILGL